MALSIKLKHCNDMQKTRMRYDGELAKQDIESRKYGKGSKLSKEEQYRGDVFWSVEYGG